MKSEVGSGVYGKVYHSIDSDNNEYALKRVNISKYGISNIMELIIFSSFSHPYLAKAYGFSIHDNYVYIQTQLARSNLSSYLRINKLSLPHSRVICNQICQAVYCLHHYNIIHGDIKPDNCLLIDHGNVMLTDFSLSVYCWPGRKYTHTVSSLYYRPLENHLKEEWDKSLDIWSLGLMMYHIVYGEKLINIDNCKNKEEVIISRLRSWDEVRRYINKKSRSRDYSMFNNLILKMLKIDKNKRISIDKVLNHEFFSEYPIVKFNGEKFATINRNIDYSHINYLKYLIREYANSSECIFNISLSILEICDNNDKSTIKSCFWIAYKIYYDKPCAKMNISRENMIYYEKIIDKYTHFRLYYPMIQGRSPQYMKHNDTEI
jgi:serine/threonine protein kinase